MKSPDGVPAWNVGPGRKLKNPLRPTTIKASARNIRDIKIADFIKNSYFFKNH
jgi:hypothetical protein